MNRISTKLALAILGAAALLQASCAPISASGPLVIQSQGSFASGGTMITAPGVFDPLHPDGPAGQTYRGDHLYAFYQVPVRARPYPLIMWHGTGQFSKTWETTPDGREGFQTLFLRRRFGVYVIDQPRRGNAGRSMVGGTIEPTPDEQYWFGQLRLGVWPDYFPGVQFARDTNTLDQFFRQMTPNIGPYDIDVVSDAVSALVGRVGPAILMTHSRAGGPGWLTAVKNSDVKGIVAFEPGSDFLFPEDDLPDPIVSAGGTISPMAVTRAQFMSLTRIPIVIFYGDNIPAEPTTVPGPDGWRARLAMARRWANAVNAAGGDVTVVHLPDIGIHGNTHFPFSDLNNVVVADQVSAFLASRGLD
jgi:hypothetical protein